MNRAALIEQIQEARKILVAHLYQARREYRRTCETAGKSGNQIERCVISTSFQIAESMDFAANLANANNLLRVRHRRARIRYPITLKTVSLAEVRDILDEVKLPRAEKRLPITAVL
jgi:hypothetical protein